MAHTAKSINGVTIRLPDERWVHITEEHAEMAGYLYDVLETVQDRWQYLKETKVNCSPLVRSNLANTSLPFIVK
jgi:hypothetical protein